MKSNSMNSRYSSCAVPSTVLSVQPVDFDARTVNTLCVVTIPVSEVYYPMLLCSGSVKFTVVTMHCIILKLHKQYANITSLIAVFHSRLPNYHPLNSSQNRLYSFVKYTARFHAV